MVEIYRRLESVMDGLKLFLVSFAVTSLQVQDLSKLYQGGVAKVCIPVYYIMKSYRGLAACSPRNFFVKIHARRLLLILILGTQSLQFLTNRISTGATRTLCARTCKHSVSCTAPYSADKVNSRKFAGKPRPVQTLH